MSAYSYLENYLNYLKNVFKYEVSIRDFVGFTSKDPDIAKVLIPYYVHHSPYCLYVKYEAKLEKTCTGIGWKFMKKCTESPGPFIGTCYCGYSDLIIPVKYKGTAVAAVCMGGFDFCPDLHTQKMENTARHYNLKLCKLRQAYTESIVDDIKPNLEHMECAGGVLADFLSIYYQSLVSSGIVDPGAGYMPDNTWLATLSKAMSYIRTNYKDPIRVEDIARYCHCSVSYISHTFQKNTNKSISCFINDTRLEQARLLLSSTEMPLHEIAVDCGYNDPNYLSTVFKKYFGISPTEYRRKMNSNMENSNEK